jgi:hypothetical protein
MEETPFRSVPWEVRLIKVFFWHSLDKDVSCACPLQGASNASIRNMRMGAYHLVWQKTINILKQNGQHLFGGQKIWEGIRDEDIKATYEKFMPPLDNLSKMSFFLLLYILG